MPTSRGCFRGSDRRGLFPLADSSHGWRPPRMPRCSRHWALRTTRPGPTHGSPARALTSVLATDTETTLELSRARTRYMRWLTTTRDLSPHTLRAYSSDIAAFERYVGTDRGVDSLDRHQIAEFLGHQVDTGMAPSSVRRRAATLRGFCRWLATEQVLAEDPSAGISVARGRGRRLPRPVPGDDLARLLMWLRAAAERERSGPTTAVDGYHQTTLLAVAVMVSTGVRVHEVVRIRTCDVDLAAGSIRIFGKGRRERQVYLPDPWITDVTQDYVTARARLGLIHDRLLFNVRLDPLTEAALRARLRIAAEAAGVAEPVTPHMLRHSAATQLIEAGVDIRFVQRLLGHASLSTTEIYTHVSDRTLRNVVGGADVLGRLLGR